MRRIGIEDPSIPREEIQILICSNWSTSTVMLSSSRSRRHQRGDPHPPLIHDGDELIMKMVIRIYEIDDELSSTTIPFD